MDRLRIAIAGLTPGSSGITTYTKGLINVLNRRGHQVFVVTSVLDDGFASSVQQLRLPSEYPRSSVLTLALPVRSMVLTSRYVIRILQPWSPDIVHFTFPPWGAAVTPQLPAVATAWFTPHNLVERFRIMAPFFPRTPHGWAMALLEQYGFFRTDDSCFRGARKIIALTKSACRDLADQGFLAEFLPPGIDLPDGDGPVRTDIDVPFRIAFVANRLEDPRKGLRFLLESLRILCLERNVRGLSLHLMGKHSQALTETLAAMGLRDFCHLHGFMTGSEYWRLLRACHVLVSPSLYEEWGYAVLEGMSVGLPVIGFRHAAMTEMVDPRCGIIVPPKEVLALAEAIQRLLTDRELLMRMSRNSVKRVEDQFSWERVVPRMEELYKSASSSS